MKKELQGMVHSNTVGDSWVCTGSLAPPPPRKALGASSPGSMEEMLRTSVNTKHYEWRQDVRLEVLSNRGTPPPRGLAAHSACLAVGPMLLW
eukprot:1848100-Pyramimonas_sp.AAC.1